MGLGDCRDNNKVALVLGWDCETIQSHACQRNISAMDKCSAVCASQWIAVTLQCIVFTKIKFGPCNSGGLRWGWGFVCEYPGWFPLLHSLHSLLVMAEGGREEWKAVVSTVACCLLNSDYFWSQTLSLFCLQPSREDSSGTEPQDRRHESKRNHKTDFCQIQINWNNISQ